MPQDGNAVVGDLSGLGGDGSGLVQGYGIPGAMMGYGGMGYGGLGFQDPAWTGAMARQKYAMALMQQGSQITPLRSPWQAAARALQGGLGAWEFGQAQAAAQQQAQQWQKDIAPSADRIAAIYAGLAGGGQGAQPQAQAASFRQPGQGMEPPASADAIAALPGIQALPTEIRPLAVQAAVNAQMGPNAAQNWAGNILRVESGGRQFDKNGNVILGPPTKYGRAVGAGQMMPSTFDAVAKANGITGSINDPGANLATSALYYQDGLNRTNGDPAGAAAYYVGGPGQLHAYVTGTNIDPMTTDYLRQTNATPGQMMAVSGVGGGGAGGVAPGAGLQAYLQMMAEAERLSMNPMNPYGQAMRQYLMAAAPQLLRLGQFTPPVPIPGTNLATQTEVATGRQATVGQQLSGESIAGKAISELQRISRIPPDQRSAEDQQAYEFNYQQLANQGRWNMTDAGPFYEPPPALSQFARPPSVARPGAAAPAPAPPAIAPAPGQPSPPAAPVPPAPAPAPPDVSTVTPPAIVKNVQQAIAADQDMANTFSAKAQQNTGDLQTTAQIRSIAEHVPTNIGAAIQGQLARILSGASYDPDTVKSITQGVSASDAEVLQKLFTQLSARQTGALGGGFEVLRNFESRFPDITSRPESIKEFTQSLDYQIHYDQRRAELMHQWIEQNRRNLTGYNSIGSPEFNAFAQAHGLDPRIYGAAAMAAAGQPYSTYTRGLDAAAGEDRRAARLAWQFNPNIQVIGPDGRPHARPSSMIGGQ